MSGDGIEESRDDQREEQVGAEPRAPGHGAGNDGRRGADEDRLEDEEDGQPGVVSEVQEEIGRADQPGVAEAEHEGEAERTEDPDRDCEVGDILDCHVDVVFGAHQPALDAEKFRLHQNNQGRRQQNPDVVEIGLNLLQLFHAGHGGSALRCLLSGNLS